MQQIGERPRVSLVLVKRGGLWEAHCMEFRLGYYGFRLGAAFWNRG